ncbi:MAG: AEC family transporter [Eubacteriales bacterium]
MFKIFFIVAFGYQLRRRGILKNSDQKVISTILLQVGVPFTIIMSSQQTFSKEGAVAIIATTIITFLFFWISVPILIALGKKWKLPPERARVFTCSMLFYNATFIGFPLISELFGREGLLCAVAVSSVQGLLFFSWGVAHLRNEGSANLKAIFSNQTAILSLIALVMYFAQITIPPLLSEVFSSIAAITTPLSMVIIGCSLAESGIIQIISNRTLYLATAIRTLVMPGVMFAVLSLLQVPTLVLQISTVATALPAGAMVVIVATEANAEPTYAANIMVQSTLAMMFTIPLWAFLVGG